MTGSVLQPGLLGQVSVTRHVSHPCSAVSPMPSSAIVRTPATPSVLPACLHKSQLLQRAPPCLRLQAGRRAASSVRCRSSAADGQDEASVVCFGEALFDCLAEEVGVPKEEVKHWTPYPGGAPANVAAALGKLGARVFFITALGNDDLSQQMEKLLEGRNVQLGTVQRTQRPLRDVLVTRATDGDRTFSGFGVAAAGEYADCFIEADKLPEDVIKSAGFLVTGTLGLAYPVTAAAMRRAVQLTKGTPCQVLIDINWRPVFWGDEDEARRTILDYVAGADIVKLSDEEAEWLLGIRASTALEHPGEVLQRLPRAKGVLVTAGGSGCSYAFHGAGGKMELAGRVPVLDINVLDTTGAGDAFLAGFLFSMVKAGGVEALQADADKLRAAVQFAAACGAYTTTDYGAIDAQPTREEAERLLQTTQFVEA